MTSSPCIACRKLIDHRQESTCHEQPLYKARNGWMPLVVVRCVWSDKHASDRMLRGPEVAYYML